MTLNGDLPPSPRAHADDREFEAGPVVGPGRKVVPWRT
jgi:hypothetical protein